MKKTLVLSTSLKTILPICMLVYTSAVVAQDINSGVIVSADAVQYYFNDDKAQNNDLGYQLNLEVPFSNRWSLNVKYLDVNSKPSNGLGKSDVDFIHAGTSYNFNRYYGFQPFAGLGVGDLTITRPTQDTNKATFNMNAGAKYFFKNNWLGKVEAMMIEPSGSLDRDLTLSASLGFSLGQQRARTAPLALVTPMQQLDLDSDGDGVIDRRDDCPNTNAGLAVDQYGCVILDADQRRQALQVRFDFDQAVVKDEYQDEIEEFAVFMRRYNETNAVIEGHTDSTGDDAWNQGLSERRARAVMDTLVTRYGVEASRLSIVGYGESKPVASNSTLLGRQQNRRIEADVSVQIMVERPR